MTHLKYFESLHFGPVCKISNSFKCLLLCFFQAFINSCETLAIVKLILKQNNAEYSVFGVGMNDFRLNCRYLALARKRESSSFSTHDFRHGHEMLQVIICLMLLNILKGQSFDIFEDLFCFDLR